MASILALHGPNLNLLGTREPEHYGLETLASIDKALQQMAEEAGHQLLSYQSNAEHELIARIHKAKLEKVDLLIFNPAAFTHTSIALRDALLAVKIPLIEIHISNPQAREPFRHLSYFSDIAIGTISGFGSYSYQLALLAGLNYLSKI